MQRFNRFLLTLLILLILSPFGFAEEKRSDHAYESFLYNADTMVKLPVKITEVEHVQVYKTAEVPKWSCWTRAWFTPKGHIRVSFLDMSGGPAGLKSSYSYECALPEALAKLGIKRCYRWFESQDSGRTWQQINEVAASDPLKPQPDSFLLLDNNLFLGIGGVWSIWDIEKNSYSTNIIGHAMAWISSDGGQSWSTPVSLNNPDQSKAYSCHPRQLRDGTIVVPAYGIFDLKNPGVAGIDSPPERGLFTDAWLWFSKDRGKTWSRPLLLARGIPTRTNDEPELVELGNGDLLVVLRHANLLAKDAAVYLNCGQIIVKKTTSGWQAGPLRQTNMQFRGFPALLRTRKGILICAGSNNQFNFSVDEGQTWSDTCKIPDPKYNRHNHYPRLLELPDGRILSIYHIGNHWPYPPPPENQWIHATSFRVHR